MKIFRRAIMPEGFAAGGVACGVKKSGKPDLALLYSRVPAVVACMFTTNTVKAAPVLINLNRLKESKFFRAVIVNSGNANCYTGKDGINDDKKIARAAARALGIEETGVLTASTGIIGRRMPVDKVTSAVGALVASLSARGIHKAAAAILTTDTFTKEITAEYACGGKKITICAIAKGSGMIAPDMATMLAFVLTDAAITHAALNRALRPAVAKSFNCLTVDGCMSTNDSVMVFANGASAHRTITGGRDFALFARALAAVCLELARLIARDGEGATKFISITVAGARSFAEARTAALSIANSNLFKCAVYGENRNFGRIAAALGSSGIGAREGDIRIKACSLKKKDVTVVVTMNRGNASATVYTSDLTPEYVKINAEYS